MDMYITLALGGEWSLVDWDCEFGPAMMWWSGLGESKTGVGLVLCLGETFRHMDSRLSSSKSDYADL